MQAQQVEPDGPACVDDSTACRWMWDLTGQRWLAELSDVALVPFRILLILVLALVVRWLLLRALRRVLRRSAQGQPPVMLRPLPERVRNSVQVATTLSPERRRQRTEAIGSAIRSFLTLVIFVITGLLILAELNVNLAPLIAGAGIAGLALGFGAQSLVRDLVAGMFILLEDQYGVGDVVDLGEAYGTVEAVGLRVTTLRDLQGVYWYVPNGEIRRVGNRSQGTASVVVDIPIGFAPVDAAAAALRRGAEALAGDEELADLLVEPPEPMGVVDVTVEGATFRTLVKATPDGQWHVGNELRRRQAEALQEAGLADQILAARVYPRGIGGAGSQP